MNTTLNAINPIAFQTSVLAHKGPILVDFTAAWCAPCRLLKPTLLRVAHQLHLPAVQIDIEQGRELVTQYQVRHMPTLIVFREGKEVGRITGNLPATRLRALLEEAIAT